MLVPTGDGDPMSKLFLAAGALFVAALAPLAASADEDITPGATTEAAALPTAHVPPSPPERSVPPAPSAESSTAKSLNIDVKVDGNGIRVGGRLLGDKGVSQAWLGAQARGDSYGVDGGYQANGGPPRDLKLNLDLLPGWARTAARIWLMLP
jgi:hypothetical protein